MTARGIRNNNPGNIRHSADKWQGAADEQTDGEFVTFKSPEFGIRAIARVLLTYKARGIDTVDGIIRAWAPPSENNTQAYIDDVCQSGSFGPNEKIDVDDVDTMLPLVRAIIRHETGAGYPDSVLEDGLRLAGVYNAEPKPLTQSRTIQGSIATAAGGGLAAAAEVVRQVQDVRDVIEPGLDFVTWLTTYGPWVAAAVIAGAAAWIIWSRYEDRQRLGH